MLVSGSLQARFGPKFRTFSHMFGYFRVFSHIQACFGLASGSLGGPQARFRLASGSLRSKVSHSFAHFRNFRAFSRILAHSGSLQARFRLAWGCPGLLQARFRLASVKSFAQVRTSSRIFALFRTFRLASGSLHARLGVPRLASGSLQARFGPKFPT